MSEHFFGLHRGHLPARADNIAQKFGAWHVNYTEPGTGILRGWFACPNRGQPFNGITAQQVVDAIVAAGLWDRTEVQR
jgi:hypothetical protein